MSRLDEIQARLEGVTPGPWKLWGMSIMADPVGNSDLDDAIDVASTHMTIDGKPRTFDATFIAHTREDVPELVAAVRAVQALHKPGLVRLETLGFDFDTDEYRTRVVTPCAGCHHEYPCPTAKALDQIGGAS